MKNEKKKILDFVAKYRTLLLANGIDVAFSTLSDDWFVYNYNKEYRYYEYFIRFHSVSELVKIITDELNFEFNCAIENNIPVPSCESASIAEQILTYSGGTQ